MSAPILLLNRLGRDQGPVLIPIRAITRVEPDDHHGSKVWDVFGDVTYVREDFSLIVALLGDLVVSAEGWSR